MQHLQPLLELHPIIQAAIGFCAVLTIALLKGRMLDRRIEAGDFSAVLTDWGWGRFAKLARDYSIGGYFRIARDVAALFKSVSDKEALTREIFGLFTRMLARVLRSKSGREFVKARLADADKTPPAPEDDLAAVVTPAVA